MSKSKKAKVIMHPVRIKILQTFIGGNKLTVQQIQKHLKDVPQATLYRHLNKLVEADILSVVQENQVRGTIEKVYSLVPEAATIDNEEIKKTSKEEHFNYFLTFLLGLLQDFEDYLSEDEIDLMEDGVGYRQVGLYLSDDEFIEFANKLNKIFLEASKHEPAPNRTLRHFTSISIPKK